MALKLITASDLMLKEIVIPKMIVPGILPVGLTIFAGLPKLGKSWLALDLAVSVASGETFLGRHVDHGNALYLALEDTETRLKSRLQTRCKSGAPLDRLDLTTGCPPLDKGGAKEITEWVKNAADPKLVVVDVLQKVRPENNSGRLYDADYASVTPLKQIADTYGIAVIAVTHVGKSDPGMDPLNAISATTGLVAAADHGLLLQRGADGLTLYGRGRDVEVFHISLKRDQMNRHEALGDPSTVHQSEARKRILAVLPPDGSKIGPMEIAMRAKLKEGVVKQHLRRMLKDGEALLLGRGAYAAPAPVSGSSLS